MSRRERATAEIAGERERRQEEGREGERGTTRKQERKRQKETDEERETRDEKRGEKESASEDQGIVRREKSRRANESIGGSGSGKRRRRASKSALFSLSTLLSRPSTRLPVRPSQPPLALVIPCHRCSSGSRSVGGGGGGGGGDGGEDVVSSGRRRCRLWPLLPPFPVH